jgi:hypothetical protein
LLHKAQVLTKRNSLNTNLDLLQITQTLLRGVGESSQRLMGWVFSLVEPATSKGGRGNFYTYLPKTSHWKLASRNQNIRFYNWNIQNLNYSHYSSNRTLRFVKPEHPIFQGSVRCAVYKVIMFHSSHLGFWVILSIKTLLIILIVSILIER